MHPPLRRDAWTRFAAVLSHYPRLSLAVKTAVAAAVAWTVVRALPAEVAEEYPYYAPLGAVIAVSTTVASSVRDSLQGVLAIALGAAVAWGASAVLPVNVATLAVVIAISTLIGGWRPVGAMASFVPTAALFVLIIGVADTSQFVLAYAGLVTLGAAVGIGANLLFPPLPLNQTQSTVSRLQDTLADQLDSLAEGLLSEEPLEPDDWQARRWDIETLSADTHAMVQQATEARRGNWRASRWRDQADRQYHQARTLEDLAYLVEEATSLVISEEAADEHVGAGTPLRPRVAHTFQSMAELLRGIDGGGVDPEQFQATKDVLGKLVEEVRDTRARTGADLFAIASLILTLRRALASLSLRAEA
jgi:uncharacterized membrane protein YgaE (UPF0421/DUF939 family)